MDTLELIGLLITLLIGVVALITLVVKLIGRSSDRESKAREALEKELRADIERAADDAGKYKFRIGKLEDQRTADLELINEQKQDIDDLTTQVNTLLQEMKNMQTRLAQSETREQEKDIEIERLRDKNEQTTKQAALLSKDNETLKAQHGVWEKMIDKFIPEKPSDNTTEPRADVIVAGASGIEEK